MWLRLESSFEVHWKKQIEKRQCFRFLAFLRFLYKINILTFFVILCIFFFLNFVIWFHLEHLSIDLVLQLLFQNAIWPFIMPEKSNQRGYYTSLFVHGKAKDCIHPWILKGSWDSPCFFINSMRLSTIVLIKGDIWKTQCYKHTSDINMIVV